MASYNQITESIQSLRAESAPDSVTPERVGNLLQAIVDLIKALSSIPDTDVTSVIQSINQALTTANAANAAASAANTNANNKLITQFKGAATASTLTLTVKQQGHSAISFQVPIADASHAGIVLPATLQSIADAAALAARNKLSDLSYAFVSGGIYITFKGAEGQNLLTKLLPNATQSRPGLFSSGDKIKLDSLPPDGVASLDDAGRVPAGEAPQVMIRNIAEQAGYFDDNPLQPGDFYFDGGNIIYHESATQDRIMGPPSKNVVYCHTDTDLLYRWTGSMFTPIRTSPDAGLEKRIIRVYSASTKRYDIPSGIFASVGPTTNVININLLAPASGMPFYRIQLECAHFYDDGDALIVDQINWPLDIIWENNPPTIDDVIENWGVIVTIYGTWASFIKY